MSMTVNERMRRYRARLKGEIILRLKPGPKKGWKHASIKTDPNAPITKHPDELAGDVVSTRPKKPKKVKVELPSINDVPSNTTIAITSEPSAPVEIVSSPKETIVQAKEWLEFGELSAKLGISRGWLQARLPKIRWRGFPASAEYNVADVKRELTVR